jgi:hypothetical protein
MCSFVKISISSHSTYAYTFTDTCLSMTAHLRNLYDICLYERCQSTSFVFFAYKWKPYDRRSFSTFIALAQPFLIRHFGLISMLILFGLIDKKNIVAWTDDFIREYRRDIFTRHYDWFICVRDIDQVDCIDYSMMIHKMLVYQTIKSSSDK